MLKFFFIIFLFILSFLSDFFSKFYIRNSFNYETKIQIIKINHFMNFHISCNKGISFSFFENFHKNFLLIFIGIFLVVLSIYVIRTIFKYFDKKNIIPGNNFLFICGLILILGGAYGNFFDRILYGCVLDFLDLHLKDYHFFIFNIADFFISLGFFLIVLNEIIFYFYKNQLQIDL
jgi:signal peptidase II